MRPSLRPHDRRLFVLSLVMAAVVGPQPSPAQQADHAAARNQKVDRPSLPGFAYGEGYRSGSTHYLKGNGVFWSVVSRRTHPDKRDTEGDIVVLADGSPLHEPGIDFADAERHVVWER